MHSGRGIRSVTAGEHTGASEVRLHKRTRVAAADVPRSGSDTALYSVRREKIRELPRCTWQKGLDTGDMILRDEVEIPETMTGSELHDKLAEMGGKLIVRTLEELQAGTAPRIPQEGETCYASMISKGGAEARLHQARSPGSGLYPCDVRGALRLHYARRKAAEGLQRGACGEERCGAARGSHRPGYLHGSLRRRRG